MRKWSLKKRNIFEYHLNGISKKLQILEKTYRIMSNANNLKESCPKMLF